MNLDIYYGFTLLLLFVISVFARILFVRYVAFYIKFPNKSFLLIVLRRIVMSRIKNNPAASKSLIEILHETCSQLQKEGLCVLWMLKPSVMICNAKTMKAFANEQCILSKSSDYKLIRELFGDSVFTADADGWRIRKKRLNPAFKRPMLKYHVPMINESAITLVNRLMKLPNETPVHILRLLQSCSFSNIYEFLTGNIAKEPEKRAEVENNIDNINMIVHSLIYRILRPWLIPMITWKLFSSGQAYVEALGNFNDFSKNILLEMKESVLSEKEKEKDGFSDASKSFAQLLVQQHLKNPDFTFQDMHDEMKGLIAAGFDTISHTLMWALFLLGHDEEIQEKLFNELDGFMANELTSDDLQHLPYLDSVVQETLRFYPTVPIYAKTLDKEVQYEKYTFPKGTDLVFMTYMVHRDPKYFADPEKFYPERFLEKDPDKKITTYAFAEGTRPCIGKQYALMQVKIVLAHLIKNFKVASLDRKEDVRLHWEIVLSTKKPMYFRFSQRLQMQTH